MQEIERKKERFVLVSSHSATMKTLTSERKTTRFQINISQTTINFDTSCSCEKRSDKYITVRKHVEIRFSMT